MKNKIWWYKKEEEVDQKAQKTKQTLLLVEVCNNKFSNNLFQLNIIKLTWNHIRIFNAALNVDKDFKREKS